MIKYVGAVFAVVLLTGFTEVAFGETDDSPSKPLTLIRDNSDPSTLFTTGWSISNQESNRYGEDYRLIERGTGEETATFVFEVPCAGTYSLFEWHPTLYNSAYDAQISIHHALGETRQTINQHYYGGQWNPMGSYQFGRGRYELTIFNTASLGIVVLADAFKLEMQCIAGDCNGDRVVDGCDVDFIIENYHTENQSDLSGDGYLDGLDLMILAGNWNAGL